MRIMHKIVALLLAVFMMANTTIAYSVDIHFCSGEFNSLSFFGSSIDCSNCADHGMIKVSKVSACCSAREHSNDDLQGFHSKGCCEHSKFTQNVDLSKVEQHLHIAAVKDFLGMETIPLFRQFGTVIVQKAELSPFPDDLFLLRKNDFLALLQCFLI